MHNERRRRRRRRILRRVSVMVDWSPPKFVFSEIVFPGPPLGGPEGGKTITGTNDMKSSTEIL